MAKLVQFLAITMVLALSQLDLTHGCVCTREMNPVCGSNGMTYGNPCEFNCAQKLKSELTIRHMGRCKVEEKVQVDDSCFCTKEFKPVCGSDSNTYSNTCEFTCAQNRRTDLQISHKGSCSGDTSNLIL